MWPFHLKIWTVGLEKISLGKVVPIPRWGHESDSQYSCSLQDIVSVWELWKYVNPKILVSICLAISVNLLTMIDHAPMWLGPRELKLKLTAVFHNLACTCICALAQTCECTQNHLLTMIFFTDHLMKND